MIYIDKHPNIKEGEGYTRAYLVESFDEEQQRFLPSLQDEECFNRFRSHDAGIKSLLLREQGGRCCYCMRRISADAKDSNIEHLVPKRCAEEDFAYYANYSDLLNHHVCHSKIFEGRNHTDKKAVARAGKLPHMVAYENLVASCIDSNHCNSARGNEKIPPLPIIRDIENRYFYSKVGRIVSLEEESEYDKALDVLGLNCELLRLIRLLWRKAVDTGYNIAQITSLKAVEERQLFLCHVFGKQSITDLRAEWLIFAPVAENGSTHYWDMFMMYDWFYDYYKHHDKFGNRI